METYETKFEGEVIMNLNKTCRSCKKKKKISNFNDIDFGWGHSKKSSWCKVCDAKMDKERKKQNNKWLRVQKKIRKEFVASGGVIGPIIVGRSAKLIGDKLFVINEGREL